MRKRNRGLRRVWIAIGAAAILVYSLAPLCWLLIASITPELKGDVSQPWLMNRTVTYFPASPSLHKTRSSL